MFFLTFVFAKPYLLFFKLIGLSTEFDRISFKKHLTSPLLGIVVLNFGFTLKLILGALGSL